MCKNKKHLAQHLAYDKYSIGDNYCYYTSNIKGCGMEKIKATKIIDKLLKLPWLW